MVVDAVVFLDFFFFLRFVEVVVVPFATKDCNTKESLLLDPKVVVEGDTKPVSQKRSDSLSIYTEKKIARGDSWSFF